MPVPARQGRGPSPRRGRPRSPPASGRTPAAPRARSSGGRRGAARGNASTLPSSPRTTAAAADGHGRIEPGAAALPVPLPLPPGPAPLTRQEPPVPAMLRRRQWSPRLQRHPRPQPMARGGTKRPRARQPMAARRRHVTSAARSRQEALGAPQPRPRSGQNHHTGRSWEPELLLGLSGGRRVHPGTLAGRPQGAQDTLAPFRSGTGQCSWVSPFPTRAKRLLCYVIVSELLKGMLLIINIKSNYGGVCLE